MSREEKRLAENHDVFDLADTVRYHAFEAKRELADLHSRLIDVEKRLADLSRSIWHVQIMVALLLGGAIKAEFWP